MLLITQYCTYQ